MIRNIFKSVIFKRILVVFTVGLVSRLVVNLFFEINLFKNYGINISSIDCGFITGFFIIIYELFGINFNILNYKLIKNSIIAYVENRLIEGDKIMCGEEGFKKDPKVNISGDQLVYTQNNSNEKGYSSRSTASNSGGRRSSAGVAGLYGESGRTRRPSAGILGLYGEDLNRRSSSSNKESLSSRDRNVGKIVVNRDDSGMINERVSGFKTRNRVVSDVSIERGNYEYKGFQKNHYYVPKELCISLKDESIYSSSNNGSRIGVAPEAPRPTNYSTPETMSPLFTPINNSEGFSGSRNNVVNRG
jgi:hypothetical protein